MGQISQIDQLIAEYFTGSLKDEQYDQLRSWIEESNDNKKYFLNMQEIWISSVVGMDDKSFDKSVAYNTFLQRTKTTPQKSKFYQIRWIASVAAIITLALLSFLSYRLGRNGIKSHFSDIVVEAPKGSRTKLYLPDSTLVWLNAGSSIVYSQGYGVDNREVYITGEGYFDVRKNPKLPMKILSKEIQVEVLGTVLNFRNYIDEEEIVVSLERGKISARNMLNKGQFMTLEPNEKVTLNKKNATMVLTKSDGSNLSGWKDGKLFYDEKLLPDIIKSLERSYNVHISLSDESLKTFRFYGQFSRTNHTIEEILDRLEATGRLYYTLEGNNIILYPKEQ